MKRITSVFLFAQALFGAECLEIDGDWIRPQDLAKVFGVPPVASARPLATPPWGVSRTVRRADLGGLGLAAATALVDSACFVRASMLVTSQDLAALAAGSAEPVPRAFLGGPWRVPKGEIEIVPASAAGAGVRFAVRYGKNRYFFRPSVEPSPSVAPISQDNCRTALPVGRLWLVVEGNCVLEPRSQRWNVQALNRMRLPAGRISEPPVLANEVFTHAP